MSSKPLSPLVTSITESVFAPATFRASSSELALFDASTIVRKFLTVVPVKPPASRSYTKLIPFVLILFVVTLRSKSNKIEFTFWSTFSLDVFMSETYPIADV